MRASLPMYDLPEIRWATDALWAALGGRLGANPELERAGDHTALWREPDLLFSQTCGYPFTHRYRGQLRLVATPQYRAPGCEGANYRSLIMAREPSPLGCFRGKRAAFNNADSMSGMLALQLVFEPFAKDGTFFASARPSGGHLNSLAMLREGGADVCAIDCVTAELVRRHRPALLEGLVEIARGPAVPGLPYVTSLQTPAADVARLRAALRETLNDPALAAARQALLIEGATELSAEDYDVILELEHAMNLRGGVLLSPPAA